MKGELKKKPQEWQDAWVYFIICSIFVLMVTAFVFWQKDFFFSREKEAPIQIAVVLPDNALIQQGELREGMEQAAFDYNCELNFLAPIRPYDIQEQNELINRQSESRPNGLILYPIQMSVQREAMTLQSMKQPLYLINSTNTMLRNSRNISPDYKDMAEKLVQRILKERPELKTAYLVYSVAQNPANEIHVLLEQAFLQRGLSDIKTLVYDECSDTTGKSCDLSKEELLSEKTVCISLDEAALKRLTSVFSEEDLPLNQAPLYAWNAGSRGMSYLENGLVSVLVVDNQYAIGYLSVSQLAENLRNNNELEDLRISYALIDHENLDSVANQRLLYPIVQ